MITLPSYNLPLGFRQFIRNYFNVGNAEKKANTGKVVQETDLKFAPYLIISDDPFTSFVFGRYIEKWNGRVDIASSIEQAIAELSRNQYKVVLFDLKGSLSAATESRQLLLQKLNLVKNTATIALIDEKTDAVRTELVTFGIKDWLDKEINPSDLQQKLVFYSR